MMIQQEYTRSKSKRARNTEVRRLMTMMARRTEVELESTRGTAAATTTTASAGEELRERMTTAEATTGEPALERIATLSGHRVVRIVTVVESLPELGICQYFIVLVDGRHLSL